MSLSGTVTHSFGNINMIVTICMFVCVCVCVVSCLPWLSLHWLYLALFTFVCIIYVL